MTKRTSKSTNNFYHCNDDFVVYLLRFSTSPLNSTNLQHHEHAHFNALNSFDLESADELGIHGHKLTCHTNSAVMNVSPIKPVQAASITHSINQTDSHNNMNGLLYMFMVVSVYCSMMLSSQA
jgi:hypothetical protein